ncbi:MAG: asparagine synthase (glutamine-hydrolyzing), partial [Verrucomicrobiota bacterium]
MCGIAGFFGEGTQATIDQMTDALAHRGPDGRGTWKHPKKPLYLGHRRLSIVDLEGGAQPMQTVHPRLVITYNGELYNHRELRQELTKAGHQFTSSHSDTEVILRAYAEWGPWMVDRFNGMWAFALYDFEKDRVLLSRDRFGQKPLFYHVGDYELIFASELKALMQSPRIDRSVSETGLIKYFSHGFIPAPHTYIKGANKLPAGHQLLFDIGTGEYEIQRYWEYQMEADPEHLQRSTSSLAQEFKELLQQSIQRRLVADVPVGCFLSGGIDSSTVSKLAVDISGAEHMKTFSIGFRESSFDESRYAQTVADALRTDHLCEVLSLDQSKELLPKIIQQLDEPLGDPSLLPTYLVSKVARSKVKVVLGGDGADELFSGYDPFRALAPSRLYQSFIPQFLHSRIREVMELLPVSHRNMSLDFKIKRTLRGLSYPPHLWAPLWMSPLDLPLLEQLFGRSLEVEDVYSEAITAWNVGFRSKNWHDALTQFYVRLYLQDNILVKID